MPHICLASGLGETDGVRSLDETRSMQQAGTQGKAKKGRPAETSYAPPD